MPRLKQRTNALRERGVAGAIAVLAEEGAAGLTIRAVARRAQASAPAIYEVFGDKAGLIRAVFIQGYQQLADDLSKVPPTADPLADLRCLCQSFRQFVLANSVLAQVMFSRPFVDFDPTAEDAKADRKVSKLFVRSARAAVDAGLLIGDPADIADLFFAFVTGLAAVESAQRLRGSRTAVDRWWRLGLDALILGLGPAPSATRRRSNRAVHLAGGRTARGVAN